MTFSSILAVALFAVRLQAEQFTILIYETQSDLAARNDAANASQYWKTYSEFGVLLQKAGVLRGGSALTAGAAKTIQIRDGKRTVRAGSFAKAPHELGGYFVVEVADMESAMAWAAKVPAAASAAVEVRPMIPNPDMAK